MHEMLAFIQYDRPDSMASQGLFQHTTQLWRVMKRDSAPFTGALGPGFPCPLHMDIDQTPCATSMGIPGYGHRRRLATGYDPLRDDEPDRARTMAASVTQRSAFGERAGQHVRRIGSGFGDEEERPALMGHRCASVNGFSLHANTQVPAHRRDQLERVIWIISDGDVTMPMHNPPHPGLTVRHDCLESPGLTVTEGAKVLGGDAPGAKQPGER